MDLTGYGFLPLIARVRIYFIYTLQSNWWILYLFGHVVIVDCGVNQRSLQAWPVQYPHFWVRKIKNKFCLVQNWKIAAVSHAGGDLPAAHRQRRGRGQMSLHWYRGNFQVNWLIFPFHGLIYSRVEDWNEDPFHLCNGSGQSYLVLMS